MKYTFIPNGVCAQKFEADIENNIIKSFKVIAGCPGNTQAVSKLITGQTLDWAIERLQGINCRGRGTSCPDQIAKFLFSIKK